MSFIFSTSVLDSDWASHSFKLKKEDLTENYVTKRRYYTTSARSFVETSWGGHFAANPFPQFTRNCDLNHQSIYTGSRIGNGGLGDSDFGGVGRWWSEVLDDNQQEIHIRAGVVKFNSMFTFFTNFYNVEASVLSRRGKATNVFYSIGKAAGYVGTIMLQPFILGAQAIRFFLSTPRTKFYYLQPAMHLYWHAVSNMMNTYMVNAGLTQFFDPNKNTGNRSEYYDPVVTNTLNITDTIHQQNIFGSKFGDRIVTKNGGIDVFAISTRAQRLAQTYRDKVDSELNRLFDKVTKENRSKVLENFIDNKLDDVIRALPGPGAVHNVLANNTEGVTSEDSYLDIYTKFQFQTKDRHGNAMENRGELKEPVGAGADSPEGYPDSLGPSEGVGEGASEMAAMFMEQDRATAIVEQSTPEEGGGALDYFARMGNAFRGNMEMGAEFVTFRINNTGSHSESFSNTSGESGLMETINSNSSRARSARFNIMDGNITGVIGEVIDAAKDTAAGILDSVNMGGLMAMGGSAFIDIQKVYQNSSVDMMTTSITIPLRAWSADPWTIAKDIAYPLFCILALGMPKSTGSRSYDEPFLIETFLRGRSQIREGRVRSISITRGVGDIAWTKDGHALGIDVTVDIEDMSGVTGVPINPTTSRVMAGVTGLIGGAAEMVVTGGGNAVDTMAAALSKSTYSEDNKFGDYMNVLAAVDLYRQINTFQKWKVKMAQTRVSMEQWRSPNLIMAQFNSTLPGQLIQAVGRPTDRN